MAKLIPKVAAAVVNKTIPPTDKITGKNNENILYATKNAVNKEAKVIWIAFTASLFKNLSAGCTALAFYVSFSTS
jgi:hypothetical protein